MSPALALGLPSSRHHVSVVVSVVAAGLLSPAHALPTHACCTPPVGLFTPPPVALQRLSGDSSCPRPCAGNVPHFCPLPQASLVSCQVPHVLSVVLSMVLCLVLSSPGGRALRQDPHLPPGCGTRPFPDQSSYLCSWLLELQLFMFFYSGFPYFVTYS